MCAYFAQNGTAKQRTDRFTVEGLIAADNLDAKFCDRTFDSSYLYLYWQVRRYIRAADLSETEPCCTGFQFRTTNLARMISPLNSYARSK